ncbi:hypothetical protein QR680_002588 [Steinernema hermaphroditum]|uniref:Uncharacterized protein n=1 Tax=Steinernema hermaphroditum TaxID=289476 RepID=A0AA39H3A7_9BILA|nr:hypothetical protein QR680_002588 [Steinernema hermaphroditum]
MSRVLKRFVEAVDDIESPFFDRAISLAEEATGYRRAALDAHELHAFFLGGHWDTNDEVKKVDQPLPKKVFKKIALEQNQLEELRLPVKFYKGHGLVMNIIFDERDSMSLLRVTATLFSSFCSEFAKIKQMLKDVANSAEYKNRCIIYRSTVQYQKLVHFFRRITMSDLKKI